jgi:hypothetical protein
VLAIFQTFLQIALLIRPPQDLPTSRSLLNLVIFIYAALGILILWPEMGMVKSAVLVLADVLLITVFVQLILTLKSMQNRRTQTLTAMFGTGIVISVLILPMVYGVYLGGGETADRTTYLVGIYVLFAWSLTINGFIFKHAFDLQNLIIGIGYAFGLYLFSEIIMTLLFGSQIAQS